MPCDTVRKPRETAEQRAQKIRESLKRLETALMSGQASVIVGPQGAVAFKGWDGADRDSVTDVCAYRKLLAQSSSALNVAVMKAEMLAGRKVDQRQIAAGTHLHGSTWHNGH